MKVSHLLTAAVITFIVTSAAAQDTATDINKTTADTKEISTEIKNTDADTKDAVSEIKKADADAKDAAADIKKAKAEAKKAAAEKKAKNDNPPKTLLQIKDSRFSGYGGISTSYTRIGDTNSCLAGGRAGIIINDKTVLGFGGMGLVYPTDREDLTGSDYNGVFDKTSFGYGGFLAEYYFNPKDLIVFSAGTIIGSGGLLFYDNEADDDEDDDYDYEYDNFFVIEPELHVYVNVTRFCRIGIGASYRFTEGIDSGVLKDKDFRGPSASAMVQFGWF